MEDEMFMSMAMEEAKISYNRGDLPVGAVLVIEGNLVGRMGNSANTKEDWTSHAEYLVLNQFSSAIKKRRSERNVLYTTWEPCLMCAGCSVLSRVNEIVYALPDPNGGVAHIEPEYLGEWYVKKWPVMREGLLGKESFNLLERFMIENDEKWGDFLERFRKDLGKDGV